MNEKLEWLKDHKKEVLIGAGVLVSTTVLVMVGVKTRKALKVRKADGTKALEVFEDVSDEIVEAVQINLEKLPIKELGDAGKRFLEGIPEATEDTLVNVIAYVEKKDLV